MSEGLGLKASALGFFLVASGEVHTGRGLLNLPSMSGCVVLFSGVDLRFLEGDSQVLSAIRELGDFTDDLNADLSFIIFGDSGMGILGEFGSSVFSSCDFVT